jgi:hypothetical protein
MRIAFEMKEVQQKRSYYESEKIQCNFIFMVDVAFYTGYNDK